MKRTNMAWSRALHTTLALAVLVVYILQAVPRVAGAATRNCRPAASHHFRLTLDGVALELCTDLSAAAVTTTPPPDSSIQVATITDRSKGFRELSLSAIPFGTIPGSEALPKANAQALAKYRTVMHDYRTAQKATLQGEVRTTLFGKAASGKLYVVSLPIFVDRLSQVALAEWVAPAGDRLWIVRYTHQIMPNRSEQEQLTLIRSAIHDLSIQSPDPQRPSTSAGALPRAAGGDMAARGTKLQATAADLPFPSWWNGECDLSNYQAWTGGVSSYPLGGAYRGVRACGPRPNWDSGAPNPGPVVRFFPGAWGQFEWQCVELVMRYMYLAHEINPYGGNGSQVVFNYPGNHLVKVNNGTPGQIPQPGDILSFGATSTAGHTSLAVETHVDSNGNGTVKTLNQNLGGSSPDVRQGYLTLVVTNWVVGDATGWLHDQSETPPPSDTTPPIIKLNVSGTQGQNGWYTSAVTVDWELLDAESGIASSSGCTDQVVTGDTTGVTLTCSAINGTGLSSRTSTTIRIDMTAPSLSIQSPQVSDYARTTTLAVHWAATDVTSGLAGDTGMLDGQPVSNGTQLDLLTLSMGSHTLQVEAIDVAGNNSRVQVTFTIIATIASLREMTSVACARGWISRQGICASLDVKLRGAQEAHDRGNQRAAVNKLQAYLAELDAQHGKAVNHQAYTLLYGDAIYVIGTLE